MTLSKYPHGIFASPVVGGSRNSSIFESGNIWFVDGDYGSSDNAGSAPDEATADVSGAITKAIRRGVIYVRPRDTVASAQTYYVENITAPLTKPHLQILGCAPDNSMPYFGPMFKASTVTSPVLRILGAGVYVEGLEITGTGQTVNVTSIIETVNDGTVGRAYGITFRGCTIRNSKGHTIGLGAGIHIDTAIYMKIQGCLFRDNPVSIALQTTYAAINSCIIQGNIFSGATSVRDVDIWCNGDGGSGMIVDDNRFSDGLPALSDGATKKFISFSSGVYGMVSNNHFAHPSATSNTLLAAAGTIGNVPTTMLCTANWFEAEDEAEPGVCSR